MYNSATKEFFGSNLPHVTLVMNFDEAVDQAINQFGNTAIVFGGGALAGRVADVLFKKTPLFKNTQQAQHQLATFLKTKAGKWFRMGKSLAAYSFIASYVIASPFLRNYITSKRTKAANFVEMTGLKTKTKVDPELLRKKEQGYMARFVKIWGVGIGISATILALTGLAMRHQVKVPRLSKLLGKKVATYLDENLFLKEARFSKLGNWPAYLFWAIPAYIGLYTGSRDKIEKQEAIMKAAGFGLMFMILPKGVNWVAKRFLHHKQFKGIGSGENMAYLLELISGILFYGSMPTIIALFSRKRRSQKAGLLQSTSVSNQNLDLGALNITDRSFQGFLNRIKRNHQLSPLL